MVVEVQLLYRLSGKTRICCNDIKDRTSAVLQVP